MQRLLPKAITEFNVREVLPPVGLTQPFPTVHPVGRGALSAQPFHITTAC
jgi:hypothetical protein